MHGLRPHKTVASSAVGARAVNNAGNFYDGNFTDLFTADGDLGQFYTCTRLYEDFDDEYSENTVILVNTFGKTPPEERLTWPRPAKTCPSPTKWAQTKRCTSLTASLAPSASWTRL